MNRILATFRSQSKSCGKLGSPFMERLMRLCADRLGPGTPVADHIFAWPGDPSPNADSVPLRLAGALHVLKRSGNAALAAVYPPNAPDDEALWAAVADTLERNADDIITLMQSPPQTNEVRRSAAIIPALHILASHFDLPIHLSEIGASAGLNLRADLFHLDTGTRTYGPDDAGVRLAPEWSGTSPEPANLRVIRRDGVDLNPLDPERDATRLLAYLWPDQTDRIERTKAAIATAQDNPATLARADAVDWIQAEFAPRPGTLRVLFHTIAWQYLPAASRDAGDALIAKVGATATPDAPLARFSMEADGTSAALHLQLWPTGRRMAVGRADYHGRWVSWTCDSLAEAE